MRVLAVKEPEADRVLWLHVGVLVVLDEGEGRADVSSFSWPLVLEGATERAAQRYTTGIASDHVSRRSVLKAAGIVGGLTGAVQHEMAAAPAQADETPKHSIRFAVIGLDHSHINSIADTMLRSGGELVSVHSTNPEALAAIQKRFGGARVARTEDEILNDSSVQLVCSAAVPNLRGPLGVRAMRHGKDFLVDKPAVTTLEQLAEVRRAIQETSRIFGIMYGRLDSRATLHAGALVKGGAIGRLVQTLQLAPHLINPGTRPGWFWDPERYGGTLCDLGTHQADEFIYFTGSGSAEVTMSRVANVNHPDRPKFQDFGEMMIRGDRGFGYFRVDWLTPDGLGAFGDERTFLLGTEGYIEMRKTIDITGRPGADHVLIVDRKSARYIDCQNLPLPFGRQFVQDIVNRTHVAQDQAAALLATEIGAYGAEKCAVALTDSPAEPPCVNIRADAKTPSDSMGAESPPLRGDNPWRQPGDSAANEMTAGGLMDPQPNCSRLHWPSQLTFVFQSTKAPLGLSRHAQTCNSKKRG